MPFQISRIEYARLISRFDTSTQDLSKIGQSRRQEPRISFLGRFNAARAVGARIDEFVSGGSPASRRTGFSESAARVSSALDPRKPLRLQSLAFGEGMIDGIYWLYARPDSCEIAFG